jgi:hypothetical protein
MYLVVLNIIRTNNEAILNLHEVFKIKSHLEPKTLRGRAPVL